MGGDIVCVGRLSPVVVGLGGVFRVLKYIYVVSYACLFRPSAQRYDTACATYLCYPMKKKDRLHLSLLSIGSIQHNCFTLLVFRLSTFITH